MDPAAIWNGCLGSRTRQRYPTEVSPAAASQSNTAPKATLVKDAVEIGSTKPAMKKVRSLTEAIWDRIDSLCRQKQYETATKKIEAFLDGASSHKQQAEGLQMMAYVLRRQRKKIEANDILLEAVEKHSRNRGIHFNLVFGLIDCARYQEAIQFADRLIRLDKNRRWQPYTESARFHKAYALAQLGRIDEAEAELKRVRDKGNIWIQGHLSSKKLLLEQIARERRKH
jgi:tetratricopeptide (TPR) repeat protein